MVQILTTQKAPRKRLKCVKSISFVALALYATWVYWVQSSLHHVVIPTTSSSSHHKKFGGRVYCCITGQVQRLILRKKLETLLVPLQRDYGHVVDVALVLSDADAQHYSNPENLVVVQPEFDSFQNARSFLENHVEFFHVVTPTPIQTTENPRIPPAYLEKMDKLDMPSDWQQRRVQNHFRQFEALDQCYESMPKHVKYDFILRIRDDMALQTPLEWNQILPLLKDNTILASDCRTHGGMNDRLAVVSPTVAQDYFERPLQNFYAKPLHPKVHNPESYLMYNYQEPSFQKQQKRLRVVHTSAIRGIVKYVTNFKGEAIPADKEDLLFCPKPWRSWLGV